MKSIAKRIVSLMLVMVMVIGMLPVTAFAGEAKDVGTAKYKVEIVSFIRGKVDDLRCSELLEARIYKSTDNGVTWTVATDVEGTPVSKLTYTWTNSSDSNTLMAVFLTHDLNHAYFDGDTEGGAFRGGISSTAVGAQWAAFKTPGVTMGGGFGGGFGGWWPGWGGGGNQGGNTPTTFSGTATVSVRLPNGTVITDSCSDFGPPNLAADLNNIALGIFVGDTTTLLSLLAESAIVHITCTSCYVSNVVFSERKLEGGASGNDTQVIQYTSNGQGGYKIIGKDAGEAKLSMKVSKENCTAHNGQEAEVSTKIFVFKKPTTSTTTTTLTLAKDSLDSRCKYYINGVEGTQQTDGSILFTGLTPDTEYTVDVVATYVKEDDGSSVTRYAYSFVRDTTKPVYTATVNTYLDGVKMDIEDIHGEDVALYIKEAGASEYIPLTHTGTGVYSAGVENGTYYVHHKEGSGYHQVNNNQLIIANASGSVNIHHYSVTYNTNGGAFKNGEDPGKVNYASGSAVTATANIPVRDSYVFTGWSYGGKTYSANSTVSTGISAPITLLAQWSRSVDVYVNVTIDHTYRDANGVVHSDSNYDNKDIVTMDLVARESSTAPYLEVGGKTLTLSEDAHIGHTLYVDGTVADSYSGHNATLVKKTEYTDTGDAAFTDLSDEYQYYLNVEKSGYDATVTAKQQSNGDWVIDVALKFDPTSSDLEFEVKMDNAVPAELYPAAAIVKVLYFDTADSSWKVITQHDNGNPGVRVNITGKTGNMGRYPVWATESGTGDVYGYRIMVSAFVYKDGTIVPTTGTGNTSYTDKNCTATIGEVNDGKKYGGSNGLNGAYFNNSVQRGTLDAVISLEAYDVTFDAKGGKVNDVAKQTVKNQYYIPNFSDYQPTMDGHTFLGWWYKDNNGNYTEQATAGTLLTKDITLYAKWDQTLTGSLTVAGTYKLNGQTINVWESDRATEALVVLQEIASDTVHNVASQTVAITWDDATKTGTSADYNFTNLDPAKQYRIDVKLVNYTTAYQNSTTAAGNYNANDYKAVFTDEEPWETFVNGKLTFTPESYYQPLKVGATQIGSGFRPQTVLTQIWYTERGTGNAYKVISQHTASDGGIHVALKADGTTNGSYDESVWKMNYNGNLYDYQAYVADTAVNALPISIHYGATSHFDTVNGTATNVLTATLIPNKYTITYDLNTDATDDVYTYPEAHTWSYETAITYVPTREGYEFLGWFIDSDADAVKDDAESYVTKINADVHTNVTLTAQWEKADFGYTVEYYYDDVLKETESNTAEYQSSINNTYVEKKQYNGKDYALDYVTGQPLTISTNAANNVIKVYYATDVLSDTNDSTNTPDGIPDKYQAVVTFKIVNGTWTDTHDTAPKTRVFTLYTKNTTQPWTKINPAPAMGTTPTGTANTGYVDTGSWSPAIPDKVERSATYTLVFNAVEKYTVTVIVDNGTATIVDNGTATHNAETFATKNIPVASGTDLTLQFTANSGYTLDTVTVDGTAEDLTGGKYTFDNVTANHTIHVVYSKDDSGDEVPDKYQKKVTFKVVNGKWATATNTDIVQYVTLKDGNGKWDANGTATLTDIPTGMQANDNHYTPGAWNVNSFPERVSGTEPVTYTYTFKPFVYTDFVYTVEHYKQQPDGLYALAESEGITLKDILLNVAGNAFQTAQAEVSASAKNYGKHYALATHSDTRAKGEPVFGQTLTLKLFYALDSHTVKYDLNDGNATAGVNYANETILCGNTVTVKAAPHRIGYSFEGWKSAGGNLYAVNDVITVDQDVTFTAQWKKLDNLSYTVYYLEEETGKMLQTEKVVSGKTYQSTVASSSEVITISDYLFVSADPETLTISAETGENVIKLYYTRDAVGGGSNGEDPDNIPDKYQKKITFRVVNGTWSDLTNADIVRYVTLMTAGQWDVNGTATLTDIPTGMKANSGYGNGAWDTEPPVPPTTVSGTNEEVYTYTFKVKAPGGTPYFPPASSFDPVLSPGTGDSFHPALWIGMMCLSAVAIGGCVMILNRRKNGR